MINGYEWCHRVGNLQFNALIEHPFHCWLMSELEGEHFWEGYMKEVDLW